MTLISDLTPLWTEPPRPSATPTLRVGRGSVVALRHRAVLVVGDLLERTAVESDRLVAARDADDRPCWIAADAVWSDADDSTDPQHPRPIGLATARTREGALLTGISDRLGWEALQAWERGPRPPGDRGGAGQRGRRPARAGRSPRPPGPDDRDPRPGHSPLGGGGVVGQCRPPGVVRRRRAHRRCRRGGHVVELLDHAGLGAVSVDLATPLISKAGVVRYSVQLVANDDPGRRWDASTVD